MLSPTATVLQRFIVFSLAPVSPAWCSCGVARCVNDRFWVIFWTVIRSNHPTADNFPLILNDSRQTESKIMPN